MKVLVIPDIHHRIEIAERIISKIDFDKCVLLGDYFDNFGDCVYDTINAANWLKDKLKSERFICLSGNHDVSYTYPANIYVSCSGYSVAKKDAIQSVFGKLGLRKLNLFTIIDGWLYSHAGLSDTLFQELVKEHDVANVSTPNIEKIQNIFAKELARAKRNIHKNYNSYLYTVGRMRGGNSPVGGLTWCDWNEFWPINGVNQIFGHTPSKFPKINVGYSDGMTKVASMEDIVRKTIKIDKKLVNSTNYCLDTHSNHYAVVTDGVVNIYDSTYHIDIYDTGNNSFIPHNEMSSIIGAIHDFSKK
jgi:hypothetical protein